uniref:Mini-chromosome maintenance complex-binding protein n=1 Tax=Timspurckia oligopyrenoides TaxID=708627 RepID=A0A7S0ZKB3_9RHOD|mmetsp:Transcript_8544/g.15469  ORF Transcript_8544/g.15469 Transcript_8544/m.15469 type:complete len:353 (+) Transcript_8544:2-1060(+)
MCLDTESEEVAKSLNSVPSIHVLGLHRLVHNDTNPLFENASLSADVAAQELGGCAAAMRSLLLSYLQNVLGGDSLGAEYLLMYLVSHVLARTDVLTTGKFALNLIIPDSSKDLSFDHIQKLVSDIVTRAASVKVRIDSLNSMSLIPLRDPSTNRLKSSRLQLPDHTLVLLDETELSAGQLNERGVKNFQALQELAGKQTVSYDFVYHSMELPVNLPVLVVSRGGKSMVPCDSHVFLQPSHPPTNSVEDVSVMNKMRMAMSLLQSESNPEFEVPAEVNSRIEEYFVQLRKIETIRAKEAAASGPNSVEVLHLLLTVGRLLCRTVMSNSLDVDHFQHAVFLEQSRLERIPMKKQ